MKDIWFTLIAFLLIAISAALMYLYLTGRKKETTSLKSFFKVTYHKKFFVFSLAFFLVSVLMYTYSRFLFDETFLKAFMNAEILLWLAMVGLIDFKEKIIPNKLILAAIVFWTILSLFEIFVAHTMWQQVVLFSLLGGCVCGGVLLVVALIVKSALGMGDVKLFFALGLFYGLQDTYSILLVSIILMALFSITMLIFKKVNRKTAIPMAPFVAIGFLVNILMGM